MDRVEYGTLIVQDILNLHRSHELNLTPWYQRRSVWTTAQQAYLINTLFVQMPVPSIYVRHSLDDKVEKSIREVVDGQQRIRAILAYLDNKFAARHPAYKQRVMYSQLKPADAKAFRFTALSVGYLLAASDEDVIQIFGRLNSVSKTLNSQEKRNASYSGEYKQFSLEQAAKRVAMWRDLNIFSAANISRMSEIQFISDLTLNLIDGLSDFNPKALEKVYKKYDESFPHWRKIEARLDSLFSKIADLDPECIRETVFSGQPLFFSLCLAIDATKKVPPPHKLAATLHEIDGLFYEEPAFLSKSDLAFVTACKSTTQRIAQRRVRDQFIRNRIEA